LNRSWFSSHSDSTTRLSTNHDYIVRDTLDSHLHHKKMPLNSWFEGRFAYIESNYLKFALIRYILFPSAENLFSYSVRMLSSGSLLCTSRLISLKSIPYWFIEIRLNSNKPRLSVLNCKSPSSFKITSY